MSLDVLIIGGGNAALSAALMAREAGASVMVLESAPREWRGGNSMHTRNLRCMHDAPQDVLIEAYSEEEFWQDLLKVTGGLTDEHMARLAIRHSHHCRPWMVKHGVRFQPSLSGALHTARTNAFFMGGGKALINAYYRSAEKLGIQIHYNAEVNELDIENGVFKAAIVNHKTPTGELLRTERVTAKTCVMAAGGFESNLAWLREAWGQNALGEFPADNFLIRGTKFNQGTLLKHLLDLGADQIGDERFYDEGEDFWPKRYAIWGRLVAQQPGQIGYSITDAKAVGRFMPPVFEGTVAQSLPELAQKLGLNADTFMATLNAYNQACVPGHFDHTVLDDCHTEGVTPAKTHWALPLDTAPFYAYPVKPGITFTYLGLKTDDTTAVRFNHQPSPNLFVAGEMMAGNVLGKGYTAGVGMTIGTAFGRISGQQAARAALGIPESVPRLATQVMQGTADQDTRAVA